MNRNKKGRSLCRQLTVSESSDYRKSVPLLRLQGQWLERAGFPAGTKVVVKVGEGRIVLLGSRGGEEEVGHQRRGRRRNALLPHNGKEDIMSSGNLEGKLVGPHFWPACENCVHSEACKCAPRHRAFPHTWHWGREAASFPESQLILRSWVGSSVIGERHTGCHVYQVQPQQLLPIQEKRRRYLEMDREERELNGRLDRCESQGLYNNKIEALYRRYDEVLETMRALRETE